MKLWQRPAKRPARRRATLLLPMAIAAAVAATAVRIHRRRASHADSEARRFALPGEHDLTPHGTSSRDSAGIPAGPART